MAHYAHILTVNRYRFAANIGFYEAERQKLQEIEVSFRLYFAAAIASNSDDGAKFFDYAQLCKVLKKASDGRHFNLVEFMAMELFKALRAHLDTHEGADVKLWLELNKINAPVPGLQGGASFVHSDLPAGSTFIPSVL